MQGSCACLSFHEYKITHPLCHTGAAGAFVGANDQFLVILANDGLSASVFDTAKIGFAPPAAALLLDLSGSGAVNIFPGPQPLPQTG